MGKVGILTITPQPLALEQRQLPYACPRRFGVLQSQYGLRFVP